MTKHRDRKQPTGKEIMKRNPPDDLGLRPSRFESDPKQAYTAQQLAEIGAITLKWNQIEAHIEFIATFICFHKSPLWLRTWLNGKLSATFKLDLLKEYLKHADLFDEKTTPLLSDCFAQIEQCRNYRNAIVHHHIYDHKNGIGAYTGRSSSPYQILISLEALSNLYQILCALLDELREIDLLFRVETDAQRPGHLDTLTGKFQPFNTHKLENETIPGHVQRILTLQKSRRELRKLPKFPDADRVREMNQKKDADPD